MAVPMPNYRDIVDLIKKGSTIEAQEKIMDLREIALGLQEENLALRDEIRQLRAALDIVPTIKRKGNCYYRLDDIDFDHPYCITCWDADRKLVGLIIEQRLYGKEKTITCNICAARRRHV